MESRVHNMSTKYKSSSILRKRALRLTCMFCGSIMRCISAGSASMAPSAGFEAAICRSIGFEDII